MAASSLWNTRRQSEACLNEDLKPFAELFDEAFSLIDICIGRLEDLENPLGRVCGLVLIKARNLALGCYSLSLDALAQEAGALFRPLIECLELLTYFRSDPVRVDEALEGRLPKAGVVAKKIEGKFQNLRGYLNTCASHLSLSPDAMGHLIDFKAGRLRPVQGHHPAVLRQNLRTLLAVLIWLAIEAVNCTSVGKGGVDHKLCDQVENFKHRALLVIGHLKDEK